MKFSYFGDKQRSATPLLFGTLTPTTRLKPRSAAVLLCNPFGEEAVRAHRAYRVLATQLARAGYPVLRFDYSSTGDSMGESSDATLDGWLADIEAAAREVGAASKTLGSGGTATSRHTVVVGLRLGATLAALATSRRGLRPRHLVLWDPVVDGAAYLQELAVAHAEYMKLELAGWSDRRRGSAPDIERASRERELPTEALGASLHSKLASEIAKIDLTTEQINAEQITVVASSAVGLHDPKLEQLRTRLSNVPRPSTKWMALTSRTPWNSDSALNSQVVPMDIIEPIIQRIEEVSA